MPIPAGEDNQADPDTPPRQQRMQYSQQHQIPQGQSEQLLLQQQRQEEDTSSPSARQQKVAQFLTDCNLLQYYPLFIAEGFDQIEAVYEVTELDLIQMGVKRGHRRVCKLLQRAIANARGFTSTPPVYVHSTPYGTLASPGNEFPPPVATPLPTPAAAATATNINPPMSTNTTQPTAAAAAVSPPHLQTQTTATLPSIGSLLFFHHTPQPSSSSSSVNTAYQAGAGNAAHSSLSSTEEDNAPTENVDRGWKRKYQRHAKADVNAPIKPPSAYVMFSNQVRAEVKDQNLSFTEVAKEVGERWKNLPPEEKEQYERRASLARDEYTVALSRYKQTEEYREYQQYLNDFNLKYGTRAGSSRSGRRRARRRGGANPSPSTIAGAVTEPQPSPSSNTPDPGLQ